MLFCSDVDTKVIDSRLVIGGSQVRRRRQCPVCKERLTTSKVAALVMPWVIKINKRRDSFNENKMRRRILKVLEKLLVSENDFQKSIRHVKS